MNASKTTSIEFIPNPALDTDEISEVEKTIRKMNQTKSTFSVHEETIEIKANLVTCQFSYQEDKNNETEAGAKGSFKGAIAKSLSEFNGKGKGRFQ